ncbi:MAG: hypothetical protein JWM80_4302 [Cyanobacteria bacterium RYN_339]|nr:hypothetical protein [Cyanobacteria bacterium RYN_339]
MGILGLAASAVLATAMPALASLNTDLCSASAGGDYSSVMAAVQLGASPNTRDRLGRTPIAWAARNGHTRVVDYLLAHGAYIDATDADGYTALMWAARMGHFETVSYLAGHGANPNYRTYQGEDAYQLSRYGRDYRVTDVLWRYVHGEMVGSRPKAHRASPTLGMAAAAPKPPAKPAPKPVAMATPKPVPVAVATPAPLPTPAPVAMAKEPDMLAKAIAIKKLAEAGGRATTELDNFIKGANGNPMALMDPDVPLGKDLLTLYANVGKTQSLVAARDEWKAIAAKWNNRKESHFAQNITDIDLILKDAGL